MIVGDKLENYKFINPYIYEEYYVFYEELGDLDGEQKILGEDSYSVKIIATLYPINKKIDANELDYLYDKESNIVTIICGIEKLVFVNLKRGLI